MYFETIYLMMRVRVLFKQDDDDEEEDDDSGRRAHQKPSTDGAQ